MRSNSSKSSKEVVGRRDASTRARTLFRIAAVTVMAMAVSFVPTVTASAQGDTSTPTGPTTVGATTTAGPGIPTTTLSGASTTAGTTGGGTTTPSSTTNSGLVSTTVPATVPATVSTTVPATTTPLVPSRILKVGMKGDDVLTMEYKLDLLRYDVGTVDTKFDWQTWQGLMAFQKLNGIPRTAKFDLKTQAALAVATVPGGVIPNGGLPRVEVDISRQVLLYFDAYGLNRVVAVSTGTGKSYCSISKKTEQKVCGVAVTPRGNYRIQRRIKGDRESDLGHLYNPMYFNGGFAIHGSPSIPAGPASHGCVRVSNYTANWMFDTVTNGTPVYVFD